MELYMEARLSKDEVINTRVDKETKDFLKRAATLAGLDLSSYIIAKAKEAAANDIIKYDQANRILLSDEQFDFAQSVVDRPAKVTPKLSEALKRHRKK
jgi:uncharacterized protein (DUF1778 family)